MMKKMICILLAFTLVLSMMACGGNKDYDRLADIKERGYIEVTTEPYFAPYEFIDPSKSGDEQYVGLDIMLAQAIADEIGVELRIVPLEFTAVQAGIADGKYDLALSAMAYSPARAEAMSLSAVYRASDTGYGFLVREEDGDKYVDIASLADAVVITQSGSVQEGLYNDNVEECAEFKLVSAMTDGYLAVAEGKADVCIVSTASAQLYADANGGLVVPEFRFEVDPNMNGTVAAAPPEGSDALMEVVNAVIADLSQSGQLDAWYDEYAEYAKNLGIE